MIKHDVLAFVEAVGESLGPDSRYFHMGVTSSDILDTALALLLRRATAARASTSSRRCRRAVAGLARTHRRTLVVGRTHGMHAEPTTLGLKFAVWYDELGRAIERLERAASEVEVGKLSGAVGNYSHLSPADERSRSARWGSRPERPATQVVQRDRHADFVAAPRPARRARLERIALEVRHLQRTEVAEMEEPFDARPEGILGDAPQAQSHRARADLRAGPAGAGATPWRRSRTSPCGTSATSATRRSSG